ncbi:SusC/RagA family TonB-linked outer membrane protein [Reichenbachiella ulvae]|uniref:TonB-dependent receptor n=1 Tax=Reichenbachiella ulvae TaxID=2980104 RepID=A0ABT3CNN6_9BACT|nr:TonB-dependent receptor [Reichenbachiella ulvae]MCV9385229.1 TonB-dependent receptor [Reichenbachiella ulvae]
MKRITWGLLLNLTFVLSVAAQGIKIKGKVQDINRQGLPGVTVVIEGTDTGTITDIEGNYSISAPDNQASLIFSFVGMKQVILPVNGQSVIDVTMQDDIQQLEAVMVVAYGTSTKEAFTGAAEVVDSEVIENRPVSSFEKALQGATPGLMVSSASGQPGSSAAVRIRGIGSLSASSSPLYVLDGVPIDGSISDINPNDIESITVLKDAAAASLYGSRAANGVVVITTKQGQKGKTQISFSSNFGVSSRVSDGYELMNSSQIYEHSWMGLYNQALIEGKSNQESKDFANENVKEIVGFNPFGVDQPLDNNGKVIPGTQIHTDTDWRDEIYKNGLISNINLNVSGGSDITQVFFSLGYFDDSGTVLSSDFTRYTSKINVTHNINSFITAGIKSNLSYSESNAPPSGSGGANPVRSAEMINAASPVFNADGTYNWDNKAVFDFNPVGLSDLNLYESETKRSMVNVFLDFQILPTLTFRTTGSIDNTDGKALVHYNPEHGDGAGVNGRSSASSSGNISWNISNVLNYSKSTERSLFEILVGQESIGADFTLLSAEATDFAVPGYPDLIWGASPEAPSSFGSSWRMLSYLGQIKYEFENKYFLSASARSDGSSRFGENNQYGLFYSVGAGWTLSQENWLPSVEWLNNLKLRGSYGTSGNNNIGNYASLGLYGSGANYGGSPGITPIQLANPNLSWEKISSLNIGLETRLFDKLDLTVEYYNRASDELLFAQPLSAGTGIGSILTNLGAMINTGWEGALNYDIIRNDAFSSNIGFNISTNDNEILKLNTDKIISGTKLLEQGSSIYQFYMREWAGVNPDDGQPMWYVNANSDDKETSENPDSAYSDPLGSGKQVTSEYSDAERIRMGTALPDFFGGINYSVNYKGIDLSFYFYYSLGGKVYNLDYAANMHDGTQPGSNLAADALNAWTPNNRFTDVPRYVTNNTDQGEQLSSRFLEDASYLRLKNITLAYSFPELACERMHLQGLRLFVSGENLMTFSKFKGFDPEGALNGTTNSRIPGVKVVTAGLKVNL